MADDVWSDPDTKAWMARASADLVPRLSASDLNVSLLKGGTASEASIQFAVELGLSIMMDKPILAVVLDGQPIPPKLLAVADGVVHLHDRELRTPAGQKKVAQAISKMMRKLGLDEDDT